MNPTVKEGRKTIRVVLAEDQGMVLGALAALLEIEGDILVVGQARNGKEALDAVLAQKPDVFITDIEMPHMTGLDVAVELKRRKTGTRVIIVTTFARTGYLRRALEAGALGYLLKDMRAEELAEAVRRVQQGLRVIHPELATEAWGENILVAAVVVAMWQLDPRHRSRTAALVLAAGLVALGVEGIKRSAARERPCSTGPRCSARRRGWWATSSRSRGRTPRRCGTACSCRWAT